MSKSQIQLPHYLQKRAEISVTLMVFDDYLQKRAEISVTLIVFDDILCDIRAYTVTVSYRRSA